MNISSLPWKRSAASLKVFATVQQKVVQEVVSKDPRPTHHHIREGLRNNGKHSSVRTVQTRVGAVRVMGTKNIISVVEEITAGISALHLVQNRLPAHIVNVNVLGMDVRGPDPRIVPVMGLDGQEFIG